MSRAHTDRVTHRHLHFIATITQTRLYCWLNCRFMFSSCPSHTHTFAMHFYYRKTFGRKKKCTIHTHTYTFSLKCIVANCCFYRRTAIRLREKIADERKTTKQRAKKKVLFEIYLKFNPTTNLNLLPVDVLGPSPEPTSKLTFAQIAAGWAHCHNSTMRW